MKSALLLTVHGLFALTSLASAQTNYWLKETDGYWHESHWSLGVLPGAIQSVEFSTARSKNLIIASTTARSHPESLRVMQIVVSAPEEGMVNSLVLNRAGLSSPLRTRAFVLGPNAVLTMVNSAVEVEGEFQINGVVNHGGVSRVTASNLFVGTGLSAEYNLTNGVLLAGTNIVGYRSAASFNHFGGSHIAKSLEVRDADYLLSDGELRAENLVLAERYALPGYFLQSGGVVTASNSISVGHNDGDGRYELRDGTLQALRITVGSVPNYSSGRTVHGAGEFVQSGGSNLVGGLTVGKLDSSGGLGSYRLSGGLLASKGAAVGDFVQSGGIHAIDGPLSVIGGISYTGETLAEGRYDLTAGTLSCGWLSVGRSRFQQSGGTNEVTTLSFNSGYGKGVYELSGGRLISGNVTLPGETFRQTGGTHEIKDYLYFHDHLEGYPTPTYELAGGELIVRDIYLRSRAVLRQTGGTINQNGKLSLVGGQWEIGTGTHRVGALELEDGFSNSTLILPGSSAVVRFLPCVRMTWHTNRAVLIIRNWRGSVGGGGLHQVIFGSTASGLTAQQLRRIYFRDPAGFGFGDYPAVILATGEIVPSTPAPAAMQYTKSGNALHLQWPAGYVLETATNIAGPFTDVPGAVSEHHVIITPGRARFLRLRN